MIRILAILALLIPWNSATNAQTIVRTGRPQGVVPPPQLPLPGSPLQHLTFRTPPRVPMAPSPLSSYWWYATAWPVWYDEPPIAFNNAIQVPAAAPPLPAAPVELRARLTLNLPPRARVWLGGTEVDANASPVILDSPVLRDGQSYSFDIKVTWPEPGRTEERSRIVRVEAGEGKSLTYTATR